MVDDRRDYEAHRDRVADRQSEQSKAGREIGSLPKIKDPKRRKKCERNFRLFCETYFAAAFPLKWSADHLKLLKKIERAVLDGGLFALAVPRGSGKTTLCERAVIWAVIYGHHRYAMLIGADEEKAKTNLAKIQMEFETNEILAADFPEVCVPIQKLERIANRAKGQTFEGTHTRIEWGKNRIILPTIPASKASGAIIGVGGITSAVRGAAYTTPDGKVLRPSLAVIDDPQTRESAGSALQNNTRESIVAADVLGLAGPGETITGLMPCTVIKKGDMADRLLDRKQHPEWQGERMKLLYKFPDDMAKWEEYREVFAEKLRADAEADEVRSAANAFYKKHRKAMDKGAVVAWPERKEKHELSALQHAMNLFFRSPEAFHSEYQNEPLDDAPDEGNQLSSDDVATKVNGLARGLVPLGASHVTCFIDIQKALLYYLVVAWFDDFTGFVLDYGAWPDQKRYFFTLSDAKPTIQTEFKGKGLEAQMHAALSALTGDLLAREWRGEDETVFHITRCLIDANWGESTDVVYDFCRRSPHAAVLMPSHGKFVGASGQAFSEIKRQRGEKIGHHWRIPNTRGKRATRYVIIDTNYWKSFIQSRLATAIGDAGCLSVWQAKPHVHRMLGEQLTSEYSVATTAKGRTVDEWKLRPGRPDNHFLDCVVGNAVAASLQGVTLSETAAAAHAPRRRQRVSLSAVQATNRSGKPAATPPAKPTPKPTSATPPAAAEAPAVAAPAGKGRMKLSELQKQKRQAR